MKKTLLPLIAALSLAAALPAARAEVSAQAWLETYYLNPQPSDVARQIVRLSDSGYFDRQENVATAIGFLSAIFAANPDRVDGWLRQMGDLPVAHQRLVAGALWQAGNDRGNQMLAALSNDSAYRAQIRNLASTPGMRVLDTPVQSKSSMNLQWGAFLATGDERHILRVFDAIGTGQPGLDTAARVALAQNAAAHPRVMDICRTQLDRQPSEVREVLRAAVNAASSTAPRS